MPSLLDIAPLTKDVDVNGKRVRVVGVSALGLAHLVAKFPELGQLLQAKSPNLTPARLMEAFPDAIAAVLAAGTGHPGEADHEAAAARIPVATQAKLLMAIWDLTFPDGFAPFVEEASAWLDSVGLGTVVSTKGLGTK